MIFQRAEKQRIEDEKRKKAQEFVQLDKERREREVMSGFLKKQSCHLLREMYYNLFFIFYEDILYI